ncbi:MAG: hypothetical protein LBQ78_03470 [Tannerellaceae bacterium]|nr:hypothetical protein [Tannerellaceae bacterium]
MTAQQETEYNRRGDEAMERQDYRDARLFYGEGILQCDIYSITQLTSIWLVNEPMRTSMYNVMNRCLNCLQVKATENDTVAISKLILYYEEGIGTPKSEELASYWVDRLNGFRQPVRADNGFTEVRPVRTGRRMRFFAGYAFSPVMPVGVTVGGVGSRIGWYGRFKTNASFRKSDYLFADGRPQMTEEAYLRPLGKKRNAFAATAGLVVKCTPWLYTSAGAGYGKYDLLYSYTQLDDEAAEVGKIWFKNRDASYKGVSAEIDVAVKWRAAYLSAGVNTLSFKYVDWSVGMGVFF